MLYVWGRLYFYFLLGNIMIVNEIINKIHNNDAIDEIHFKKYTSYSFVGYKEGKKQIVYIGLNVSLIDRMRLRLAMWWWRKCKKKVAL